MGIEAQVSQTLTINAAEVGAMGMVVDRFDASPINEQAADEPICSAAVDLAVWMGAANGVLDTDTIQHTLGALPFGMEPPDEAVDRHRARTVVRARDEIVPGAAGTPSGGPASDVAAQAPFLHNTSTFAIDIWTHHRIRFSTAPAWERNVGAGP